MLHDRALLFYASRRYLLRHLYHDLQDLSVKTSPDPGTPVVMFDAGETELEVLPAPSSATTVPAVSRKRPFHSALSRALFSLCFSESCTLFFLLICQALELFHPRCVCYHAEELADSSSCCGVSVRLFNWKVSLCILIIAIVLVIPLSYSIVLSYRSTPPGSEYPSQSCRMCHSTRSIQCHPLANELSP